MSDQAARRGLFLDRDGVINVDKGYVHRVEDFEFIPGIFDLVRRASELDYVIIVITNQSGIGRGYFSEEEFHTLMGWVSERFREHGGRLDAVYFCPDDPSKFNQGTTTEVRRKPSPAMIFEAQRNHSLDLSRSILVGDKSTDIEAGVSAGVGKVYLFSAETRVMGGQLLDDLCKILPALNS